MKPTVKTIAATTSLTADRRRRALAFIRRALASCPPDSALDTAPSLSVSDQTAREAVAASATTVAPSAALRFGGGDESDELASILGRLSVLGVRERRTAGDETSFVFSFGVNPSEAAQSVPAVAGKGDRRPAPNEPHRDALGRPYIQAPFPTTAPIPRPPKSRATVARDEAPAVIAAALALTAAALDESPIDRARRECVTTAEECRARNRMACPYHGLQYMKAALLAHLQASGAQTATVEITPDAETKGVFHATVKCVSAEKERLAVSRAIDSFLRMKGIDAESFAGIRDGKAGMSATFELLDAEDPDLTEADVADRPPDPAAIAATLGEPPTTSSAAPATTSLASPAPSPASAPTAAEETAAKERARRLRELDDRTARYESIVRGAHAEMCDVKADAEDATVRPHGDSDGDDYDGYAEDGMDPSPSEADELDDDNARPDTDFVEYFATCEPYRAAQEIVARADEHLAALKALRENAPHPPTEEFLAAYDKAVRRADAYDHALDSRIMAAYNHVHMAKAAFDGDWREGTKPCVPASVLYRHFRRRYLASRRACAAALDALNEPLDLLRRDDPAAAKSLLDSRAAKGLRCLATNFAAAEENLYLSEADIENAVADGSDCSDALATYFRLTGGVSSMLERIAAEAENVASRVPPREENPVHFRPHPDSTPGSVADRFALPPLFDAPPSEDAYRRTDFPAVMRDLVPFADDGLVTRHMARSLRDAADAAEADPSPSATARYETIRATVLDALDKTVAKRLEGVCSAVKGERAAENALLPEIAAQTETLLRTNPSALPAILAGRDKQRADALATAFSDRLHGLEETIAERFPATADHAAKRAAIESLEAGCRELAADRAGLASARHDLLVSLYRAMPAAPGRTPRDAIGLLRGETAEAYVARCEAEGREPPATMLRLDAAVRRRERALADRETPHAALSNAQLQTVMDEVMRHSSPGVYCADWVADRALTDHFRNLFETRIGETTGNGGGATQKLNRATAERALYGTSFTDRALVHDEATAAKCEKYGLLNPKNPRVDFVDSFDASQYTMVDPEYKVEYEACRRRGAAFVRLRPSRVCCTVTLGDSLDTYNHLADIHYNAYGPSPITAVSATSVHPDLHRRIAELVSTRAYEGMDARSLARHLDLDYVEVQFHGRVTAEDVESIDYENEESLIALSEEAREAIRRNHIRVMVDGEDREV